MNQGRSVVIKVVGECGGGDGQHLHAKVKRFSAALSHHQQAFRRKMDNSSRTQHELYQHTLSVLIEQPL